jgi:hypothetical protein
VYLFAPIAVMSFAWYAAALQSVSLQMSMAGVLLHHVRFMRHGRRVDLVTAAGWLVLALFFWEKGLVILPVMLMVSMLWFPSAAGVRGALGGLRRDRWLWCIYSAIAATYLVLYATLTTPDRGPPQPLSMYLRVGWRALTGGAIPYLLGGPFGDARNSVGGIPGVHFGTVYLAVAVTAMAITIHRFRPAWRAWLLFFVYLLMNVVVNTASRAYLFGEGTGLSARYFCDMVMVATIAVPLSLASVRDPLLVEPSPPVAPRRSGAVVVWMVTVVYILCSVATSWFAVRGLPADRIRSYMATARADIERLGPVVVHDAVAPNGILMAGRVSDVIIPMRLGVRFDEPTDQLYAADATGHLTPATVQKAAEALPGPNGKCGTRVDNGGTSRLTLGGTLPRWGWVVRIDYFIGSDAAASIDTGGARQGFAVRSDRHTLYVPINDRIDHIDVSLYGASAPMCITRLVVGLVPDAPSPRTG